MAYEYNKKAASSTLDLTHQFEIEHLFCLTKLGPRRCVKEDGQG
jgi:hypothetical protein